MDAYKCSTVDFATLLVESFGTQVAVSAVSV